MIRGRSRSQLAARAPNAAGRRHLSVSLACRSRWTCRSRRTSRSWACWSDASHPSRRSNCRTRCRMGRPHRESGDRADRIAQPAADRSPRGRIRSSQYRPVLRDSPFIGARSRQDDPCGNGRRVPAAVTTHTPGQTPLAIHRAKQSIGVDELGLQLDDEEGASPRMPQDEVDDAPLPEDVERHLRHGRPRYGVTSQRTRDRLVQARVAERQHPVQFPAAPSRDPAEADLQGAADSPEEVGGIRPKVAALHQRDGLATHVGGVGEVLLAPSPSDPRHSDRRAESDVIHPTSM